MVVVIAVIKSVYGSHKFWKKTKLLYFSPRIRLSLVIKAASYS